jgi:hypothetical protein
MPAQEITREIVPDDALEHDVEPIANRGRVKRREGCWLDDWFRTGDNYR